MPIPGGAGAGAAALRTASRTRIEDAAQGGVQTTKTQSEAPQSQVMDHVRQIRKHLSHLSEICSMLESEHAREPAMPVGPVYSPESSVSPRTLLSRRNDPSSMKSKLSFGKDVPDDENQHRQPIKGLLFPPLDGIGRHGSQEVKQISSDPSVDQPRATTPVGARRTHPGFETLYEALVSGSDEDVQDMLRAGHDPNMLYSNFKLLGKDWASGGPLTIAVLRGQISTVRILVRYKADPNTEYSFEAGAEQLIWSGTTIHAAVPSGSIDLIKELFKCNADLHAVGSNRANLVWQAAYFGQIGILKYLLDMHVEANARALSQDDSLLRYTPLHAAANAGHCAVVKMLLQHKGDFQMDDGCGHQPLDDAVAKGHADVVRQLVTANADIFRTIAPKVEMERRLSIVSESELRPTAKALRCLDKVFQSDNTLLLTAVAQGLAHAPRLLDRLDKDDLIHFLNSAGGAPINILGAIFQPHPIRYWQETSGKRHRMMRSAAFVDSKEGVNIVQGPHCRVVEKGFSERIVLTGKLKQFLDRILPMERTSGCNMYVPVTSYMCHIPLLHKELQVLLAIADCKDINIFGDKGCQAIINMKWAAEKYGSHGRMVMAFIEVMNLALLNWILNNHSIQNRSGVLICANILALVVWAVAVTLEISQAVGYIVNNLHRRYFTSTRYWFDWIVCFTTGMVILFTGLLGEKADESPQYSTVLGVLVFLKWMRLLISLRQLRTIGLRILPITTTMWDVGPFCGVLSVYIVGSVNMYYALGINNLGESFMLIYRIVVMGDVDLYELEGVFNPSMRVGADGVISQSAPEQTEYYVVVRVMLVVISFVMGLSMMNLFVAMLCLSYSQAAENAWFSFMQSRAGIVLDQHAIRLGLRRMGGMFCVCRRRSDSGEEQGQSLCSELLDDDSKESETAYIWLACQKDATS